MSPMQINSTDSFERALGSSLQLIGKVPPNAVLDYFRLYSDTALTHSKRSQASLIHDHMIDWAEKLLPAEFKLLDMRQRILFNFKDQLLLQFNKLESKARRAATNSSLQSLLFDDTGEVGLPGFDAVLPLVTVGYVLKDDGVNLEGVYAVRFIHGIPEWSLKLDEGEDGGNVLTTIISPNAPTTTPSRIKRPSTGRPSINEFGSGQS